LNAKLLFSSAHSAEPTPADGNVQMFCDGGWSLLFLVIFAFWTLDGGKLDALLIDWLYDVIELGLVTWTFN